MMSAKVLVEYPALSEIIEELDERFIIGLDRAVLTDSKLIFFKIQKAFWYYKDHFEDVIRRRLAPNLGLDAFGQILIEQSALLSQIYPHSLRESKFREWQDYLRRVPRLGAICLNPALTKVLMIQPFGRNRKNLQFPRGKLHAGEDHVKAAAREVWEECGIRLENLIDSQIFFQHVIDTTMHKLYLVFPVMEELVPTIQCNKEIEAILWVPLVELPGWTANSEDDKGFFGVAPFVKDIKRFVLSHRKETNPIEEDEDNNFKTFGINEGRWSFEQMMSANSQLFGVKSTYSDAVFAQKYDARPQEEEIPSGLSVLLVSAFARGWNRR